jgi:hypothetical protein
MVFVIVVGHLSNDSLGHFNVSLRESYDHTATVAKHIKVGSGAPAEQRKRMSMYILIVRVN